MITIVKKNAFQTNIIKIEAPSITENRIRIMNKKTLFNTRAIIFEKLIVVMRNSCQHQSSTADYPQCNNQDKRLPILSNQKMNSSLKEIADVCSIEKELTFHIARHIFATTVTFPNHIPSTSFLPFRLTLTVK